MYDSLIELAWKRGQQHYFDPEGLPRSAINYFYKEAERMHLSLQKMDFQRTSCEGYLTWQHIGNELSRTKRIKEKEKKIGINFSNNAQLTNTDASYPIPLAIDERIQYRRLLNSYCKVDGYVVTDKRKRKCILVTNAIVTEPNYDFSSDTQFLDLPVQNLDDVLSLFPSQAITNREKKQTAIFLALVGGQEKPLTKGGVGTSLLLPSNLMYSGKFSSKDVKKLIKSINKTWYPTVTRNNFSENLPSFLSGTQQSIWEKISNEPQNFLSHKVNRELVQKIPNIKANTRVLEILKYSHSSLYLDDKLVWLNDCKSIDMLLIRARINRVSMPSRIEEEAAAKEKMLKERFYDQYRSDLKIPTAVCDLAESFAKIDGKDSVSANYVKDAADLIYALNREAADEIGEQTETLKRSILGMTGKARWIYNLIVEHGLSLSKSEIKEIAVQKGITDMAFEKAVLDLRLSGEIIELKKDGNIFLKKT